MKIKHNIKKLGDIIQQNRAAIFTPAENAFEEFCKSEQVFKQYVAGYYGREQWMVYHPDKSGRANTSIIDAVAYLLKVKVYVLARDNSSELIIDHETEEYGDSNKKFFMLYNGNNHFTKLNTISESDYNAAMRTTPTSQASLIASHSSVISNNARGNTEQSGITSDVTAVQQQQPRNNL